MRLRGKLNPGEHVIIATRQHYGALLPAAHYEPMGGQQVVGSNPPPGSTHSTKQGTHRTHRAESPQNR